MWILSASSTGALIRALDPSVLFGVLASIWVLPAKPIVTHEALLPRDDAVVVAEAFTLNE